MFSPYRKGIFVMRDISVQQKYAAQRLAADCAHNTDSTQWSPRRHHGAIYFDGYLWVMGGRARELQEYDRQRYEICGIHFALSIAYAEEVAIS